MIWGPWQHSNLAWWQNQSKVTLGMQERTSQILFSYRPYTETMRALLEQTSHRHQLAQHSRAAQTTSSQGLLLYAGVKQLCLGTLLWRISVWKKKHKKRKVFSCFIRNSLHWSTLHLCHNSPEVRAMWWWRGQPFGKWRWGAAEDDTPSPPAAPGRAADWGRLPSGWAEPGKSVPHRRP